MEKEAFPFVYCFTTILFIHEVSLISIRCEHNGQLQKAEPIFDGVSPVVLKLHVNKGQVATPSGKYSSKGTVQWAFLPAANVCSILYHFLHLFFGEQNMNSRSKFLLSNHINS